MPANRATTARIISAYSIGIRWRASLFGISLRKRCCEVCHSVWTWALLQRRWRLGRNVALDQQPPRANSGHADIRLERVRPRPEGVAGDDVDADAPPEREVEPARQWRASRVRLDLDVVAGQQRAVEPEAGHRGQDSGTRLVFEHQAQPVLLRLQAAQVGET